jgi:hypothetical protein
MARSNTDCRSENSPILNSSLRKRLRAWSTPSSAWLIATSAPAGSLGLGALRHAVPRPELEVVAVDPVGLAGQRLKAGPRLGGLVLGQQQARLRTVDLGTQGSVLGGAISASNWRARSVCPSSIRALASEARTSGA